MEKAFRDVDVDRDGLLRLDAFRRLVRLVDADASNDFKLDAFDRAVELSRASRLAAATDGGPSGPPAEDDEDEDDVLLVEDVVRVLTEPAVFRKEPAAACALVPVAPDRTHRTWGDSEEGAA